TPDDRRPTAVCRIHHRCWIHRLRPRGMTILYARLQPFLYLFKWLRVYNIRLGEPPFARDPHAEGNDMKPLHAVGVRVDADFDAELLGLGQLPPIDIKAMRVGV